MVLPPEPMTSRILSTGIFRDSIFGAYSLTSGRGAGMAFSMTSDRIHQAARIVFFGPCYDFRSLELSPCFIERYPSTNTRIRIKTINHFLPFFTIRLFRFSRTSQLRSLKIFSVLPFRAFISTRHILPYDKPYLVTVSIPTCRFYFDMFTNHIETKILSFLNVIA